MTVMTYAFMECFQNCRLSECMCVNILRIKWIVPQWYFRLWSFCLWHTCNMDTCIAIYIISLQFYLIFITKYSIIIFIFLRIAIKIVWNDCTLRSLTLLYAYVYNPCVLKKTWKIVIYFGTLTRTLLSHRRTFFITGLMRH